MRRFSKLCVSASLAAAAFVATSPAQAGYHLIRWHDSGLCQIWDESIPTTPWPAGSHRASASVATFLDALALKDHALKTKACTW